MNLHNQSVQNIVNSFISKSRKNSNSSQFLPTSENQTVRREVLQQDQQFIIRKADLTQFVQKIANQTYEQNSLIDSLKLELQDLQNTNHYLEQKINELTQFKLESKEAALHRSFFDLEAKYQGEKKRREHLEREVKWGNSRVKDQLSEIQRLKQAISIKNSLIKKFSQKQQTNRTEQNTDIYQTAGTKKYGHATVNSQEYYSALDAFNKSKDEKAKNSFIGKPRQIQQPNCKNNVQGRLHRHSDCDRKDRLLKQLGQKCLFLQSHVQTLTRKVLGQLVSENPAYQYAMPPKKQSQGKPQRKAASNIKGISHIQDQSCLFKLDID